MSATQAIVTAMSFFATGWASALAVACFSDGSTSSGAACVGVAAINLLLGGLYVARALGALS